MRDGDKDEEHGEGQHSEDHHRSIVRGVRPHTIALKAKYGHFFSDRPPSYLPSGLGHLICPRSTPERAQIPHDFPLCKASPCYAGMATEEDEKKDPRVLVDWTFRLGNV